MQGPKETSKVRNRLNYLKLDTQWVMNEQNAQTQKKLYNKIRSPSKPS